MKPSKYLAVASFLLLSSQALFAEVPALLAGAATVVTTPAVETFTDSNKNGRYDEGEPFLDLNGNNQYDPVWLAGNRSGRSALGVHDELSVRALALTSGEETVVFVAVDLIGYMFDQANLIRKAIESKYGIAGHRILIASTHDHSGPDTIGIWGDNHQCGKDPAYMESLRNKIIECAGRAIEARKPARLTFGKVRYDKPIDDPRPPRAVNDLLLSLRAEDLSGQTIAVLTNYALHAEVLSEDNRLVTSDFPGALREELEKHFGGVAIFIAGDVGGMQTPKVIFNSFSKRQRLGKELARQVIRSFKNQKPAEIDAISVKHESILFPITNPRFLGAIEAGLFGDTVDSLEKRGGNDILWPAEIAVVRVGPAKFMTIPGEAFPELAQPLREKMSVEYPFTLGLVNNEIGYILPKEEWQTDGYEESMSLGAETGPILTQTLLKLLQP